jgi:hypothetical protein
VRLPPNIFPVTAAVIAISLSLPCAAQISPYVYVQMSLGVPWFLYFVFLACILIPFIVMIVVAWRRYLMRSSDKDETV